MSKKCPYEKKCGGCQYIDLPYEEQLKKKQKDTNKLLKSFGKVKPIIGMKDPWHYRNKVPVSYTHLISRLSYEMNKKDEEKAVSSMAIMTGEKGADIRSLKDELNWYRGRISEHLFVLDQEAVSEYVENMEDEMCIRDSSDRVTNIG